MITSSLKIQNILSRHSEYIEGGLVKGTLKLGEVEVIGGLGKLEEGLGRLQTGKPRGRN